MNDEMRDPWKLSTKGGPLVEHKIKPSNGPINGNQFHLSNLESSFPLVSEITTKAPLSKPRQVDD